MTSYDPSEGINIMRITALVAASVAALALVACTPAAEKTDAAAANAGAPTSAAGPEATAPTPDASPSDGTATPGAEAPAAAH